MQIKHKGGATFEIKSKDIEIRLNGGISIDGFNFPGPGEYEKAGVIVNGIADGENTIYSLKVEDINICHLGHLSHDLTEEEAKQIGDVDILFLPLGEEGSAETKIALKILSKIDPRVVIPMLYADLTEFKKSEAVTDGEVDVYKVKRAELPEDERKVVIIKGQ